QSPPHILDVWEHTLDVIKRLEAILEVLAPAYDPDKAASLILGLVVLRLGRYRQQIQAHLSESLNPNRTLRSLLFFAALYHDVGKPETRTQQPDGRVRFFEHDQLGQILTSTRAQALHLSNVEIERLKVIVRHHMRPLLLAQMDELPSRRAIYRYFRDTGPAGVDICLLSLADTLGTYGASLPQEVWARQLDVIRLLLEAWWEKPSENIAPPPLLNGRDLIEQLGLQPGPLIGQLLEAIREAQASGQVTTPEQAIALAERLQGDCSGELVEPDQG
ncbi:MAG: HD domain-containing protein, partial [Anaerolineales bacterium]|nr:HD domain-containing protein [Anaerolineales bacterium]